MSLMKKRDVELIKKEALQGEGTKKDIFTRGVGRYTQQLQSIKLV